MQEEIIGIENKMIAAIWAATFIIGLFMILNKIRRFLYTFMGNLSFTAEGKKNGLSKADIKTLQK